MNRNLPAPIAFPVAAKVLIHIEMSDGTTQVCRVDKLNLNDYGCGVEFKQHFDEGGFRYPGDPRYASYTRRVEISIIGKPVLDENGNYAVMQNRQVVDY